MSKLKEIRNKHLNTKLLIMHFFYALFVGDIQPYNSYVSYLKKYGLVKLV